VFQVELLCLSTKSIARNNYAIKSENLVKTSYQLLLRLISTMALGHILMAPCLGQNIQVLAVEGDFVPGGEIEDFSLKRPAAVASRTVVFLGHVSHGAATANSALFVHTFEQGLSIYETPYLFDGDTQELRKINQATTTHAAPNNTGGVLMNGSSRPAGTFGSGEVGHFVLNLGSGEVNTVIRSEDPAANGNGQLFVTVGGRPAFNDSGQVAFWAEVLGAVGGLGDGSGIFRGSGGSLTRIVRSGQVPPDGIGFFDGFSWPSINDTGQVAFWGSIAGAEFGAEGLYVGSGGALTEIARHLDMPIPGWTIVHFTLLDGLQVNNNGNVAFRAQIDDISDFHAVFLSDGTTTDLIAVGGQSLGGGATLLGVANNLALNNQDQIAFVGGVFGSGLTSDKGIFRAESGELLTIARKSLPVPGTVSGTFERFSVFALNDNGDVAFSAQFLLGGNFQEGIFFYSDEGGLRPVILNNTPLAGSTVVDTSFLGTDSSSFRSRQPTGLDDEGNVAFWFELADGRFGVASRHMGPLHLLCEDLFHAWYVNILSPCTGLTKYSILDFIAYVEGSCPCEFPVE